MLRLLVRTLMAMGAVALVYAIGGWLNVPTMAAPHEVATM